MKAYKIGGTVEDHNGVRVGADSAEALGEYAGMVFLTMDRAEEAAEEIADNRPDGWETLEVEIQEIEIDGIEEGERYDVASVAEVMAPLPEGYNVGDYFSAAGIYAGPDEDGVGITVDS